MSMDQATVINIILGLLNEGSWDEAAQVSRILSLMMMKRELSHLQVV